MRQINSQIEFPDPLQGPFSVSGTGRRQCFFWTWFQNCLRFRVYGPRPSALYSNKRPLLTRIFCFLPSKCHRKRFVFARTCSPNIFIEKLSSAHPATGGPPKRNIGKSSHKPCSVMLGLERKCRKTSHKARAQDICSSIKSERGHVRGGEQIVYLFG